MSGLPNNDGVGAGTGALATGGKLSWAIGPSDFLVPLVVDLAFGPDMVVKRAKKKMLVYGVRVRVRIKKVFVRMIDSSLYRFRYVL